MQNTDKVYRLYAKFPNMKQFKPVNWREGRTVTNLIYASIFTESELPILKSELSLPENSHIQFDIREAK